MIAAPLNIYLICLVVALLGEGGKGKSRLILTRLVFGSVL